MKSPDTIISIFVQPLQKIFLFDFQIKWIISMDVIFSKADVIRKFIFQHYFFHFRPNILALGQELLTVLNVTFLILQVSSPARKPSFIIFSAQLFINFSINIYIDGELFGILSIKKTIDFINSPINPLSTNPTICRQTVWMCLTKCHKLTVASIMY